MPKPTRARRLVALLLLFLLPRPSSRPARMGYPDALGEYLANSF